MFERNQGQLVQHSIPYSQHHRKRRCDNHFHPPITLTTATSAANILLFLHHHQIAPPPILRPVRPLLHPLLTSPIRSHPHSSSSHSLRLRHHQPPPPQNDPLPPVHSNSTKPRNLAGSQNLPGNHWNTNAGG